MNNRKYQLLIFDWDGTLMDSAANICASLQYAICELDAEPRTEYQQRQVIGLGLTEAIYALYPQADERFVRTFTFLFRDHFLHKNDTPSPLFDGVEETLAVLRDQEYDMAVATGKSRRGLDKVLDECGLRNYFPVTYCAEETFSKPHPSMVLEILTDYDQSTHQALVIGDTEFDLQMASNANVDALAVTYGVHDRQRLASQQSVGYLDNISELNQWLETYE